MIPELINILYPNVKGIKKIQKKGRFYFWAITNGKAVSAMATIFSRENLKPIIKNDPRIIEKPLKSYLCVNWSAPERIKYVVEHFQFIDEIFGVHANDVISIDGITILEIESLSQETYRIQLYRGSSREGAIGIRLINEKGQRVYALSCNISGTENKTMHIGMLQGASDQLDNRNDLIKELTKSLFGLRTKSLLVEMALMLARILGISKVNAISNKGHVYKSIHRKRNRISFDYDALWKEFEAEKLDPYFFGLSVFTPRKDPLTLKKTKRKMYTKRYEWLDNAEIEMTNNLRPLLTDSIKERI